jgi:hypothetical protein
VVNSAQDDTQAIEEVWSKCEREPAEPSPKVFDQKHAEFLRKLVCEDTKDGKAVAEGIIRNWISDSDKEDRQEFGVQLARGLLGQDGKQCAGAKDLDQDAKDRLHLFAQASPPTTAPGPKAP